MTEQELVSQKLEALRQRNSRFLEELRRITRADPRLYLVGEEYLWIRFESGGAEVSYTDIANKDKWLERCVIFDWGLGVISRDGTRSVLGSLGVELPPSERLEFRAWEHGYPEEICNQAERVVGLIKQKLKMTTNA